MGAVLRFAPLTKLVRRRSQTSRESRRVRQPANAGGHLHQKGGPLAPATSCRTPGDGDTTSAPSPDDGLDYHVNAHLLSDVSVSTPPVRRGTTRRHPNRGMYPDKLSGYIE